MTPLQKVIKYCAVTFAVLLTISIICLIVGSLLGLSFILDNHDAVGELQKYTVSENVTQLKINISAAELEIISGDIFTVESNLKKLTVQENDGKLIISEKSNFFNASLNNAYLKLTIPSDFVFSSASITTGAGKVSVDKLSSDNLILELGAGEVTVNNLIAQKNADINGGAGKVNINSGELNNLDLDIGVGQLNLIGKLTGDCEIDCGVGETNLTLTGNNSDYEINLDKGLGNATIDGVLFDRSSHYGSGQNSIDIDGGVGAVNIIFKS